MHERGEGRPQGKLTTKKDRQQEWHSWYDRPHEELVQAFRSYVADNLASRRAAGRTWHPSPERIIEGRLVYEISLADDPEIRRRTAFFNPIYRAWQLLTFDRIKDTYGKHRTAWLLSMDYEGAKRRNLPRPDTIQLTEPLQVKILDALADALDVPREKGQSELEIPEGIRGYAERLRKQPPR